MPRPTPDYFGDVRKFNRTFCPDQVQDRPAIPDGKTCQLRVELIREEFEELQAAIASGNIYAVADALGDLTYVVFGAFVAFGIEPGSVHNEIQRSNMSKRNADGTVTRREDGKVIKSSTYSPADMAYVIGRQIDGRIAAADEDAFDYYGS